ncbi:DUF502 domain-containing protein [Aliikangiella coralliicola]|uniref:DUF502 domain-containing protein n=1 Tax=Aliikangiella coralliicola TaxID=2592383 RepID=A0A545UJR0_9GAMM|nr:DUF502 domain-containing protein [Aliikangiella coralliicola]TQV89701.1 DUF502 domain-containing protein [Aliikangiella coralliicola]
MSRLKVFVRKALLGGILVLLPVVILGAVFRWVFYFVTDLIQPLTDYMTSHYHLPELMADIMVIALILAACFAIGTIVSTSIGKWLHGHFDKYLVRLAPGYRIVKEIVSQVFGGSEASPFAKGEVVRVQLFGEACATKVTAIVTARHADNTVTIFMPTGPNPTSGNIYHVPEKLVEFYPEATVEQMMKSIIACGAGSAELFKQGKGQ